MSKRINFAAFVPGGTQVELDHRRGLDCSIAKALGWTEMHRSVVHGELLDRPENRLVGRPPGAALFDYRRLPRFSEDIADAWQMVDYLVERGWHAEIRASPYGAECKFWRQGRLPLTTGLIGGPTMPEAICVAALKALGTEVISAARGGEGGR